jgi:competence protein ComEC
MSFTAFLHQTPFFRISLSFIIGISIGYLAPTSFSVAFGLVLLSLIGLVLSHILNKKTTTSYRFRWVYGVALLALFMGMGMLSYQHKLSEVSIQLPEEKNTYTAQIIESPVEKQNSVMTVVKIIFPNSNISTKAILYVQKDSNALALQYGDYLACNTLLQKPRNTGNPYEFDYARFLLRKSITATSYISNSHWKKIETPPIFSIRKAATDTRNQLLSIYKEYGITDTEFGIVAALTVGYKEALSKETKQSFANTGGSHVLAVSGLHVGIIYIAIGFILGFMNKNKQSFVFKQIIILLSIWVYAFICGLPPSVIRASIMISLICVSELINRKSATYNAVFFSAFCMLLYNPFYLFDVGFQLSYMAVLSILYFQPRINTIFSPTTSWIKWLWSLTAVSIAAQIGTAPISMYYFHSFPTYFLLTNILVIPAATIIIYLSMLLLAFSSWMGIGNVIAWLLKHIVQLVTEGIRFIEHLPGASIQDIWIPSWFVPILFWVVILAMLYYHTKRPHYIFAISYTFIVALSISIGIRIYTLHQKSYIVYATNSPIPSFNLHVINGESNQLVADSVHKSSIVNHAKIVANKRNLQAPNFKQINTNNHFGTIGKVSYFVYKEKAKWKPIETPLPVDVVFVYTKQLYNITEITRYIQPKYLVFSSTIKGKRLQKLQAECTQMGIKYHSMYEKGAFMCPL